MLRPKANFGVTGASNNKRATVTIIQTLRAFRQAWKSELAEKRYCILFYMSLVGSVGIVGMDDLF